MSKLVHPHGGESLKPLLLAGAALKAELARARTLPRLRVSSREKGDLIMLGIGGFSPLEGFMTRADWEGVCDGYRMASGLFWPIPITLSADKAAAAGIKTGSELALVDSDSDEILAEFERLGWSKVAAFQTRNPMHRSHEYLAKVEIETCDGVLVHSLLG